jgi:SAM-dependent methyltransferase
MRFDHAIRRFVPSVTTISYAPVLGLALDAIASALALPFRELRELPPNHLRIRIGVDNRVVANHVHFLEMGSGVWMDFLSRQYCTFTSDIVELGCGCGRMARALKGGWFQGTYVGVDIDSEMIQYCRSHFPKERFDFVHSPHESATYSSRRIKAPPRDSTALRIADANSKDFIFSISLYSHLLEHELLEYLRESARILRVGGIMQMTFFCMDHVKLGERWTFRHAQGNSYIESEKYPEAAVAYTERYIREAVSGTGFGEIVVMPRTVQSSLVARKK